MGSKEDVIMNVNQRSRNTNSPGEAEIPRDMPCFEDALNLASSINQKLSTLAPDTLDYGRVCIYKVPDKHRSKNPQAYTPRLVSIGPLHHGQSQLVAMEESKLKYLTNFLHTFRVPLKWLAKYVCDQVKIVRGCYGDAYIREPRNKLSEMILLDGVFIVELLLKNHFSEMREMGDIIFDNPWVSNDILHDLLLFENQLPMRFVSTLYNAFVSGNLKKVLGDDGMDAPSFNDLVHEYFKNVGNTGKLQLSRSSRPSRHLVEFLAILHMPIHPRDGQKAPKKLEFSLCPTATELRAAGVKFCHGEEKCLFDVYFDPSKGELKIPQLSVNDSTETFFRNLIAFEQSGYHSKHMTSYVILLDTLIDTAKDVDLLVQSRIINNELGSSQVVADVFNHIYKEFVTNPQEFYFAQLCIDLNHYSRDIWHKWISKFTRWFAMLWHDYFGSPWSIISVAAAFVLLVLTVIQTVCSLLQVKHPNSN